MKNTAALSLTSNPDGRVTGKLCVFFELTLTSSRPADVNALLHARGIKKFAFMGPKSGLECSFPLTVGQLIAVASMAENAEQVDFIKQLDGDYHLALEAPRMRHGRDLPLVSCELDSGDADADIAEFRAAAVSAGWTQDEIAHAVDEALRGCEMASEIGDMLYVYGSVTFKSKSFG